jgi:hypothetical protein
MGIPSFCPFTSSQELASNGGPSVPCFPENPRARATRTLMLVCKETRIVQPLYGLGFIKQETSLFCASYHGNATRYLALRGCGGLMIEGSSFRNKYYTITNALFKAKWCMKVLLRCK